MISTSTLCFVLALSCSTFAQETIEKTEASLLLDDIASTVAHDMAQVARAADGLSTQELNNRLLDTMNNSLKRLAPELEKLYAIIGNAQDIDRRLAVKLIQNKELSDALAAGGKVSPRFIGALAMGIAQVATDVVKMVLTRY